MLSIKVGYFKRGVPPLKGGTPPTINIDSWPGTFSDTPLNAIYVPANSVETYKKADGWNKFADKIQAIK